MQSQTITLKIRGGPEIKARGILSKKQDYLVMSAYMLEKLMALCSGDLSRLECSHDITLECYDHRYLTFSHKIEGCEK